MASAARAGVKSATAAVAAAEATAAGAPEAKAAPLVTVDAMRRRAAAATSAAWGPAGAASGEGTVGSRRVPDLTDGV